MRDVIDNIRLIAGTGRQSENLGSFGRILPTNLGRILCPLMDWREVALQRTSELFFGQNSVHCVKSMGGVEAAD